MICRVWCWVLRMLLLLWPVWLLVLTLLIGAGVCAGDAGVLV
jgi:hypothetical protein